MASHDGFAHQGAGPESSLAYSVLENDDAPGGGGGGGGGPVDGGGEFEAGDLSLDSPVGTTSSSRWGGRGGRRGRGGGDVGAGSASSSSASGGLVLGFLRACAPHFLLVTVYLAFLLIGGGLYLLFENRLLAFERSYEAATEEEIETVKVSLEDTLGKKILQTDKNATDEWKALIDHLGEGYGYHADNEMTFARSVMFCATTVTTIGYGDAVPSTTGAKVTIVIVTLLGIPLTLVLLADLGKLLARGVVSALSACRSCRRPGGGRKRFDLMADGDGAGAGAGGELRAPVPVVLLLLSAYVLLSALVVALMEGWTYGQGLYFTFVTLTTVGYGDLVPVGHHQHVDSFVVLLLFVYLGLSVVAMSYFLVRDAVFACIYAVGEKLGF